MNKSFAQILAELEKTMYDSISIKDLQSGSVMSGLLDQIMNTPERRLVNFLEKLDPVRFRTAAAFARGINATNPFSSGISIGLNPLNQDIFIDSGSVEPKVPKKTN